MTERIPPVAPEGRANLDAQMDGLLSEWDASPPHGAGSEYAALCTMRRLALEVGQRIGRAALLAELSGTAGEEVEAALLVLTQTYASRLDLEAAARIVRAHVAALAKERDEADERAARAVKDRYDVLGLKTTEGLSAAEWMMRTAKAESALAASRAAALEEAALACEERASYGGPAQQYESQRCVEVIRALVPGATDGRGKE